MDTKTLIGRITIPRYIREVETSKKQRVKHYEWNGTTIKSGSKKLLQKYINPKYKELIILNNGNILPKYLKDKYHMIGFKGDKLYCGLDGEGNEEHINTLLTEKQLEKPTKYILCELYTDAKITANETQAGKPKNTVINGQNIYNGTLNPFLLGKIFDAIKLSYYNVLKDKDTSNLRKVIRESYPIIIEVEVRDTIKNVFGRQAKDERHPGTRWDVGNRTDPYMKTFLDFITVGYEDEEGNKFLPLLEDDDRLHLTSGNNSFFTPIEFEMDRALVFHIYTDDRPLWKRWYEQYEKHI